MGAHVTDNRVLFGEFGSHSMVAATALQFIGAGVALGEGLGLGDMLGEALVVGAAVGAAVALASGVWLVIRNRLLDSSAESGRAAKE